MRAAAQKRLLEPENSRVKDLRDKKAIRRVLCER